jgi:hypothetical protein
MPFLEDITDLLDSALQFMGYPANSQKAMDEAAMWIFSQMPVEEKTARKMADTVLFGAPSVIPMFPAVHQRFSMANLFPATGALKLSNAKGIENEIFEIFGTPGSFVKSFVDSGKMIGEGVGLDRAITNAAPVAIKNVLKAAEIGLTGDARDSRGSLIVSFEDPLDRFVQASLKMAGLMPKKYGDTQRLKYAIEDQKALKKVFTNRLVRDLAVARFEKNIPKQREATRAIIEWNRSNRESPEMKINMQTLSTRVQNQMLKLNTESLRRSMDKGGKAYREVYRKAIEDTEE